MAKIIWFSCLLMIDCSMIVISTVGLIITDWKIIFVALMIGGVALLYLDVSRFIRNQPLWFDR